MAEAPAADSPSTSAQTSVNETPAFIDLYDGTNLISEDAEAVTLRWPAHLVVFAGAAESGKTTVLASLYDRFNLGPFAGFHFAGSRSLLGFEEICYLNRLASGSARPDTPRTVPSYDAAFYHLAVRRSDRGSPRLHLLLSAISGELFRLARNSREDCERLTFLRRANTIVVLIDGARLAVAAHRTNAQCEASSILESFIDAKMIGHRCRVEFVFSKLDRVVEAGQTALAFLKATEEKLARKFREQVPNLAFRRIAARPEVGASNEMLEDGFADAFVAWTTATNDHGDAWQQEVPPQDSREFWKYSWRHSARREAS